jgi:hypothetical protein
LTYTVSGCILKAQSGSDAEPETPDGRPGGRKGNEMKNADVIVKCYSSEEAAQHIWQLKKNGYKRVQNCFWVEIWEKPNGWTVELDREW